MTALEKECEDLPLLDCPFCGAKTYSCLIDEDDRSLRLHIGCSDCPANMDIYLAHGIAAPKMEKIQAAVDSWNRRDPNTQFKVDLEKELK